MRFQVFLFKLDRITNERLVLGSTVDSKLSCFGQAFSGREHTKFSHLFNVLLLLLLLLLLTLLLYYYCIITATTTTSNSQLLLYHYYYHFYCNTTTTNSLLLSYHYKYYYYHLSIIVYIQRWQYKYYLLYFLMKFYFIYLSTMTSCYLGEMKNRIIDFRMLSTIYNVRY